VTPGTRRGSGDESGDTEAVPWFRAAFGTVYPIVYGHRDDAAAGREAGFAMSALEMSAGERILDLACGDGRHLEALGRLGMVAIGVDLSVTLVTRARERRSLSVVRADLRALPFAGGSFAHATCFFTSFGYFEDERENLHVLREAARVVRRGGRLLLDVPDREALVRTLVARDEVERDGLRVRSERSMQGGRVRKKVIVTNGRGDEVARFEESVRVYDLVELRALLADAGWRSIREAGDFDGRPIGQGTRYILVAERAA
jgi:SAM-dependent methyltransferase